MIAAVLTCFLVIVALQLLFRMGLPLIALHLVRKQLRTLNSYRSRIERLRLNIVRGRIIAYDISLETDPDQLPANQSRTKLHIPIMITTIRWKSIFHRKLAANIAFKQVNLDYYHHPESTLDPFENSYTVFRRKLQTVLCFILNLSLEHCRFCFHTPVAGEEEIIELSNLNVTLSDFSNESYAHATATMTMQADLFKGKMKSMITLTQMAARPTFTAQLSLHKAKLSRLNPWLKDLLKFDVSQGELSVQSEIVADNGAITGFAEPTLREVVVAGPEDRSRTIAGKIYEWMIDAAINMVGSGRKHEVRVRIPLEGTIDSLHVSVAALAPQLVRNLFRQFLPIRR